MHMCCANWSIVAPVNVVGGVSFGLARFGVSFAVKKRLCEGALCCFGHRKKVRALHLVYEVYHTMDHTVNEYLNYFIAARNTRASADLGDLALVIPRCRTDQFSRPFLPATVLLWNLLPSGVFIGGTLSSFKWL